MSAFFLRGPLMPIPIRAMRTHTHTDTQTHRHTDRRPLDQASTTKKTTAPFSAKSKLGPIQCSEVVTSRKRTWTLQKLSRNPTRTAALLQSQLQIRAMCDVNVYINVYVNVYVNVCIKVYVNIYCIRAYGG